MLFTALKPRTQHPNRDSGASRCRSSPLGLCTNRGSLNFFAKASPGVQRFRCQPVSVQIHSMSTWCWMCKTPHLCKQNLAGSAGSLECNLARVHGSLTAHSNRQDPARMGLGMGDATAAGWIGLLAADPGSRSSNPTRNEIAMAPDTIDVPAAGRCALWTLSTP